MRSVSLLSGVVATLLCFAGLLGGGTASAETTCQKRNPRTGACLIEVAVPGHSIKEVSQQGTEPRRPKRSNDAPAPTCVAGDRNIPCRDAFGGTWSSSHGCYLRPMTVQLPRSDPAWQGHKDGNLYWCYLADDSDAFSLWLAAAPGAPAPPDPEVLARRAVAAMGLTAVTIGIVPEDLPGRVGIIGLPTWMWVKDPGPGSWGPITRTASAGGYSVSATGQVDRVVWAMGDGSTVVCRKLGTPYADSFGKRSSPDCGHTYTRQGTYTVRATSYWVVTWAGMGQTGSIALDFTRSTVITMGEVQVLTQ